MATDAPHPPWLMATAGRALAPFGRNKASAAARVRLAGDRSRREDREPRLRPADGGLKPDETAEPQFRPAGLDTPPDGHDLAERPGNAGQVVQQEPEFITAGCR